MTSPQFEHALTISDLIKDSITHMKVKWQLYQSMGYLPYTDVFDMMLGELDRYSGNVVYPKLVDDGEARPITHNIAPTSIGLDPESFRAFHNMRYLLYYMTFGYLDFAANLNETKHYGVSIRIADIHCVQTG
ncbi:MAG: hypothetical protein C4B59_02075 [Candidatus Methanogaster sp.]|uniref:Uncharacterized protein n=1 Tax=Candidatus Methanogaster sp. TaxID=3386292 RepID=A0AC61L6M9_9EURY|nr:MAG: hypothetical protein C4B59_02075 [ANME-2 cluster archaeon]